MMFKCGSGHSQLHYYDCVIPIIQCDNKRAGKRKRCERKTNILIIEFLCTIFQSVESIVEDNW